MALPKIARSLASLQSEKYTLIAITQANFDNETFTGGSATITGSNRDNFALVGTMELETVELALTENILFTDDRKKKIKDFALNLKAKIRSPFTIANANDYAAEDLVLLVVDTADLVALTGYADTETDLSAMTGTFTAYFIYEGCEIVENFNKKGGDSNNQDLEFINTENYTAKTEGAGVWENYEITLAA